MNKKNLANAQLLTGINDSDTTATVKSGQGSVLPEVPFFATLSPVGVLSTIDNSEIVEVTGKSGDTLTIVRAQRGTTARSFSEDALLVNGIYVEDLAGGGYVAQDEAPEDTSLLWYDTDDDGVTPDALATMLDIVYPVGSEYTNYENGTNPATLLQMPWSTWVAVEGTVTVGLDPEDDDFDTALATGGAKTHTLTVSEMPSHNHASSSNSNFVTDSGAGVNVNTSAGSSYAFRLHSNVTANRGGGGAHNNLQPYIVAYKWRRTA